MKKSEKLKEIKEWFIIQRIRFLNLIKEHKYISSGIGVFLLTCIVVAAVNAATDEYIGGAKIETNSVSMSAKTDVEDQSTSIYAKNFSTVTYTLNYKLSHDVCSSQDGTSYKSSDNVKITATLSDVANFKWLPADESASSTISDDKKTLTLTIEQAQMCSELSQNFSLMVLNPNKDVTITPDIKISVGSGTDSSVTTPVVKTSFDQELDLTAVLKSGIAKKTSDGRDAKFGILLGINSNSELTNLEGIHIKTDAKSLKLLAYNAASSQNSLELYTSQGENDHYFGKYNSDLKFFSDNDMPTINSTSSNISLKKSDYNTQTKGEITAPVATLIGAQTETYEQTPVSVIYTDNSTIKIGDNVAAKCNGTNCTTETYKKGSSETIDKIDLNTIGDYEIHYVIGSKNTVQTTLIKNIKVIEPLNKNYSLAGQTEISMKANSTFYDLGVYNSTTGAKEIVTPECKNKNGETITFTPETVGEYTLNYTIDGNTLVRTIIIKDQEPSTSTIPVKTEDSIVFQGNSFTDDGLYINNEKVSCSSYDKKTCTATSVENSALSSAGTTKLTYTVTDENNFKYVITKNIIVVSQYYDFDISNIVTDGTLISMNNGFYAIGSYYVTVKASDNDSDIKLKAIMDNNEIPEATVSIKQNSYGTNFASNDLYVNELTEDVKVDSSAKSDSLNGNYYTAAIGEEVSLVSKFEYGYDADYNIDELTATIPVSDMLLPISASTEPSDDPYYLEATLNGTSIGNLDSKISYCTEKNECSDTYDNSKVTKYIKVIIKKKDDVTILPGTLISLKTKYVVKDLDNLTSGDDISNLSFNESTTFNWTANNVNNSSAATATSNVYVTPYKLRTNVSIGKEDDFVSSQDNTNGEQAIKLDVSKNEPYTVFAMTDVTAPAMAINSNLFGYDRIPSVIVKFTLPSGVNYVYNENYKMNPLVTKQNGQTILSYTYKNVEPNSWIEPIYFDFNVDVSLSSNFEIKTEIGNFEDKTISNDVSSSDYFKTVNSEINIDNSQKISYGQYSYSKDGSYISNIDKDGSFTISQKLHNNNLSGNDSSVSNIKLYGVLPYQTTENNFSGTYEIDNLPTNAMCTTDDASMVTKSDLVDSVKWVSCTDFKKSNGRYSGFSAYKIEYSSLALGGNIENKINVYTSGNKPDDSYNFKAYFSYTDGNNKESGYKAFRELVLPVVSKKITGIVWEDFNLDGVMDDTEKKIENINLKLYNSSNELVQSTTPDENGKYVFAAIDEGKYYIVADFNTDKYGVTSIPSKDYYDLSKLSSFITEQISKEEAASIYGYEITGDTPDTINIVKTDLITVDSDTRIIRNINLGLSLKKVFELKIDKYINRAEVTNALGMVTTKDYGKTKLAKLDVKDINNIKIKVVYTLEIQNTKYYPCYATLVTDQIPSGMSFNANYEENKGWALTDEGILENDSLSDELIHENEMKYLTVAFDITRKEAGSFTNYASIDNLQILGGNENE